MEYSELIQNRYTVRDFKPDAIPQVILEKILTAGQLAPTACNKQPQQIYIVRKPELIQKMRGITQCAYNAPVILILAGRKSEGWVNPFDNKDSTETDVSIVATHMMLAAADSNVGSTWVGWADLERIKKEFDLPSDVTVYGLLNLGYPSDASAPAPQHSDRKPLNETVAEL